MTSEINIEWDFILDNIQADRTILCLGAELFSNTIGKLDVHLRQAIGNTPDVRYYDDGLFNFKNSSDLFSHLKIKKFYNQDFPELAAILNKIAQIRFSTIISLNPDMQLNKAFDHQGFMYEYAFHHPKITADELAKPTCDEPLIYNLLGNIDVRESMVLTHEDLFEFLESAVEGKSISNTLKGKVKLASNFIFIGMPFDKWHTQLLMRVLQKDVNKKALRFAANHAKDERIEMLCQDEFNIICVPTNIADFVNELYERCKTANLLRGSTNEVNYHDKWLNMVKQDSLEEVLEQMLEYFENIQTPDEDTVNQLINLSGRLTNLNKKLIKGTISNENASLERAQIRDVIVQFLKMGNE